ncbi:hypothetical protein ACRJ4W_01600 [Streptomyces sp. GLT-R25]
MPEPGADADAHQWLHSGSLFMDPVDLPLPVVRRPSTSNDVDIDALERDLRARVDGEVQVPIGVVVPRTAEAVTVCREHGAPLAVPGPTQQIRGDAVHGDGQALHGRTVAKHLSR